MAEPHGRSWAVENEKAARTQNVLLHLDAGTPGRTMRPTTKVNSMAIIKTYLHIEVREPRVITQTITRPTTTYTALVTLGDGFNEPTPTAIPPPPNGASSTVVAISTSPGLSSEQIGAIVGSVVGFVVLLFCICCCLSIRRRRIQAMAMSYPSETEIEVVIDDQYRPVDPWDRQPRRGPIVVPPAPRYPPTPRHTPYTVHHTRSPQIKGVRRYP
ncbi:hypothetical protein B0H63DRAFT_455147 [Podospora didyma]|uniref:Mid2 domain-containing protein n=1 Tax=Podospora didyma TaxID=330526 RepID=A0AAE0N338_9PEZI|nr:hypothetical protein B0H63DRAFT_455147 [Podospora didyma]